MPFQQIRLPQLLAEVRGRLGLTVYWDDRELKACVNEALRVWQVHTGYWRGTSTISLVGGQRFYSHTLLKALRVLYAGSVLDRVNMFSMDFNRGGWFAEGPGVPDKWMPVGLDKLALHPTPASDGSATAIGLSFAPTLSGDGDYIDMGGWVLDAVMGYAAHVAMFKVGGQEFQDTMPQLKRFFAACGKQNEKFKYSSIYRRYLGEDLEGDQHPVQHEPKRTSQ